VSLGKNHDRPVGSFGHCSKRRDWGDCGSKAIDVGRCIDDCCVRLQNRYATPDVRQCETCKIDYFIFLFKVGPFLGEMSKSRSGKFLSRMNQM